MIIPFPFNYNTVEMGWNDPPTRYHSIQPFPWVFRQESWWWVMSDESWIWVRCTGGCVCKCDRRPGYFGWQRQPVDPWQIHGRLWWLWASGQWCFGTLNQPMIAMVQWSMIYTYKYKATVRAWSPDQGYRALSKLSFSFAAGIHLPKIAGHLVTQCFWPHSFKQTEVRSWRSHFISPVFFL